LEAAEQMGDWKLIYGLEKTRASADSKRGPEESPPQE